MLSINDEISFLTSFVIENLKNDHFISFDEVGRGAVFGPVTVTGVCFTLESLSLFSKQSFFKNINDSKKLSPTKRMVLYHKIISCTSYLTLHVPAFWIDKYNINVAIEYAIYRITQSFIKKIEVSEEKLSLLIDGNYNFLFSSINMPLAMPKVSTKIKGDSLFSSLASASIIAKYTRDNLIQNHSKKLLGYDLKNNKGYFTKAHQLGIQRYGLTRYHRKSFLKKFVDTV